METLLKDESCRASALPVLYTNSWEREGSPDATSMTVAQSNKASWEVGFTWRVDISLNSVGSFLDRAMLLGNESRTSPYSLEPVAMMVSSVSTDYTMHEERRTLDKRHRLFRMELTVLLSELGSVATEFISYIQIVANSPPGPLVSILCRAGSISPSPFAALLQRLDREAVPVQCIPAVCYAHNRR